MSQATYQKYCDIAETVIRFHTERGECLFAPTAILDIADAGYKAFQAGKKPPAIMDALVAAVEAAEIYCPHEGIDRRAELGLL